MSSSDLFNIAHSSLPAEIGQFFRRSDKSANRKSHNSSVLTPLTIQTTSHSQSGAHRSRIIPRPAYPCTFHCCGRSSGLTTLYAETKEARAEWEQKLRKALDSYSITHDSKRAFDLVILGDTGPQTSVSGEATCSVPFSQALSSFFTCVQLILFGR